MGNVRVSMDAYEKDYVQAAKTLEKMCVWCARVVTAAGACAGERSERGDATHVT